MRAAIMVRPGFVDVATVRDAALRNPTDALVRVVAAAICGTDIWLYRGDAEFEPGQRSGHEFVGIVEAVGEAVTSVQPGDFAVAPFLFSDGTCDQCVRGHSFACERGGSWGGPNNEDGAHGEAVRVPFADATLVRLPTDWASDDRMRRLAVLLADTLPTGEHALRRAQLADGDRVLVIGDGPIGLSAAFATRGKSASTVVVAGHHGDRLTVVEAAGLATAVELPREADAAEILGRDSFDVVVDAVGTPAAVGIALECAAPGGRVAAIGLPIPASHEVRRDLAYSKNVTVTGGVCPARSYIPDLVGVLEAYADIGAILTGDVRLAEIDAGYRAMAHRTTVKVVVTV